MTYRPNPDGYVINRTALKGAHFYLSASESINGKGGDKCISEI